MSGKTIAWVILVILLLLIAHHQIGHAIATFGQFLDTGKTSIR